MLEPDPRLRISSSKLVSLLSENRAKNRNPGESPLPKTSGERRRKIFPRLSHFHNQGTQNTLKFRSSFRSALCDSKGRWRRNLGPRKEKSTAKSPAPRALAQVPRLQMSRDRLGQSWSRSPAPAQNSFVPQGLLPEPQSRPSGACKRGSRSRRGASEELLKSGALSDINSTYFTNHKRSSQEPFRVPLDSAPWLTRRAL